MKKYMVLTAMMGMLVTPVIADETKPMTTTQPKTESGAMTTKSEKKETEKAASTTKPATEKTEKYSVHKSTSTHPVMKKAKKKTQKVQ